jgi:hypothetical protein
MNKFKPYKYMESKVQKKKKATYANILGKECKWNLRGEF